MKGVQAPSIQSVIQREVARFVAVNRRRGESDLYLGRRAVRRHHRAVPLLVTPLSPQGSVDLSVSLCDVSSNGLAFRFSRPIRVGTPLAIRLFWHDRHAHRVPAVVRNCAPLDGAWRMGCEFALDDEALCTRAAELREHWYDA